MSGMISVLQPEQVEITAELAQRTARTPDYAAQKRGISELGRLASEQPSAVLPRFVELARELCGADSAGFSVYEPAAQSAGVFRWHHLSGTLSPFAGATTPRDFSPCGICLDRSAPVLMAHPEQAYAWIREAGIAIHEVLLVPLQIGKDEPIGTLWVIAPPERQFDGEDARILSELAGATSIATHLMGPHL